jgi:CyaY protein
MLDEPHFNAIADATLTHLHDQLEEAFEQGTLEDLDLVDGVLRIEDEQGNIWIINKHTVTRQIWLASKRTGGLHFSFNHDSQDWLLPDARDLKTLLALEMQEVAGFHVVF